MMQNLRLITENIVHNILTERRLHSIIIDILNESFGHPRSNFDGLLYHKSIHMPDNIIDGAWRLFERDQNKPIVYAQKNYNPETGQYCNKWHNYEFDEVEWALRNAGRDNAEIFEVGTKKNKDTDKEYIEKYAIRMEYNDYYDVTVVCASYNKNYPKALFVITIWLNEKGYEPKNLDADMYVPSPKEEGNPSQEEASNPNDDSPYLIIRNGSNFKL